MRVLDFLKISKVYFYELFIKEFDRPYQRVNPKKAECIFYISLKFNLDVISDGHKVYRRDTIRPTSTQKFALKPALAGEDIHCLAKTGSGKTLCFGIPIVAKLQQQGLSKNNTIDEEVRSLTGRVKKLGFKPLQKQIHPDAIIIGNL